MYFWNKILHVSDSSSVHHQEFITAHTAMVYVLTACEQQRNCLKHVQFYSKNTFEKLVQLVCFIIRIYHDTWSPERQRRLRCPHVHHEGLQREQMYRVHHS